VTQTITRPGFGVSVVRGQPPSAPAAWSPAKVAATLAQLSGKNGATGGSSNPPTEASVAQSGISNTVSGNVAASVQQAAQNTPASTAPPVVNVGTVQNSVNTNTVASQGNSVVADADRSPTPPGTPISSPSTPISSPSTPISSPSTPINLGTPISGLVKVTTIGSNLGFINQTASGRIPYTGFLNNATVTGTASGVGTLFTLSPLTPGATTNVSGTTSLGGTASGTAFLTADSDFFFSNLTSTNGSDSVFVFGGVPVQQSFFAPTATNQILAFNVLPEASSGSPIPFTLPQFGGNVANATISPFYVITPAGFQFGAFNATSNPNITSPRFMQASLAINGLGAGQNSALVISTGTFDTSNAGNVYANGPVRGTVFLSGASGPTRLSSAVATVPDANGNALYGGSTIDGFVLDQNDYANGNPSPLLASAVPFGGSAVNYAFTNPVLASAVPAGVGASRTTQTLQGYLSGIMFPSTGSPYSLAGGATISTNAINNRVSATFSGDDPFTAGTSGINSVVLQFGGLTAVADGSRSAFIDDNTFAATDSASVASQINGNNLPIESPGQPGTRIALVSSGSVPGAADSLLPAGAAFCQCQYLQWGYWTGQLDQVNGSGQLTRSDSANINFWIAGQPTVTMPTTGVGTYTGAAVGSVINNGASYLAAGGFNQTYNFGSLTGTVNITNFDGANYSGSVSSAGAIPGPGVSQAAVYAGNLTAPNRNVFLFGNFFGPSASETGGEFDIQSTAGAKYLASGVFAGKR